MTLPLTIPSVSCPTNPPPSPGLAGLVCNLPRILHASVQVQEPPPGRRILCVAGADVGRPCVCSEMCVHVIACAVSVAWTDHLDSAPFPPTLARVARNPPAPPSLIADEASCTVRINGLPPTANDDLVRPRVGRSFVAMRMAG